MAKTSKTVTDNIIEKSRKEIEKKKADNFYPQNLEEKLNKPLRISKNSFRENLDKVNANWNLSAKPDMVSSKPFIGSIIVFVKKVLYRLLNWYFTDIVNRIVTFNSYVVKYLNNLNTSIKNINNDIEKIASKIKSMDISQKRLEVRTRNINNSNLLLPDTTNSNNSTDKLSIDYLMFENEFRGKSSLIKDRQKIFVKYFKNKENVLDIGCGRGEFLENLKEKGVDARGIDINEDMIMSCKEKGLNVEKADGLDFLRQLPKASTGGIFLGQLIEHLKPEELFSLIELCYQKLKPGSYLIAETINPLCVSSLSKSFFPDLSHEKPIHPETLRFLLESTGFSKIAVEFLSPTPKEERLQSIGIDDSDIDKTKFKLINKNIQKLNDLLFSYQDYAIIALKESRS